MTSCDIQATPLLPMDDAIDCVLRAAMARHGARPDPHVDLPLWDAHGHVLAASVLADRDTPPFDRSAMDGFAFRAADVPGQPLRIIGEVPAGTIFGGVVGPGEAVSIMTGAPMPEGADTVAMIERCEVTGAHVVIEGPTTLGRHIARRGEDVSEGDVAVPAGRAIQGPTVGVLAGVGAAKVTVHRPPRVTVMATGDELVEHDETPAAHQIREGNRHTVMAMLRSLRAATVDGGIVADTQEALRDAVRAAASSDVIVLSGGVSKGKYDLVKPVLEDLGMETLFHGVQAKPGKPVLFGRLDGSLVLGLPGNPVSTYVMAVLLLLPMVRALAGLAHPRTRTLSAQLKGALPPTKRRTTYHPAVLIGGAQGGPAEVTPVSWRGSGDLTGYSQCNCLIRTEVNAAAAADGAQVRVLLCG
ncbi:MAG: gephyrin-like molybdotransferase Glp [Myxococcota bacterium]